MVRLTQPTVVGRDAPALSSASCLPAPGFALLTRLLRLRRRSFLGVLGEASSEEGRPVERERTGW